MQKARVIPIGQMTITQRYLAYFNENDPVKRQIMMRTFTPGAGP